MKKKKIVTALTLLIIIMFLTGGSVAYVNDYYHADIDAYESLRDGAGVTVEFNNEDVIVFVPDSPVGKGIIFYPGGKVEHTAYAPLLYKIANEGISCILLKMPCNLAIMDIDKAEEIKRNYPNIDEWYIAGHSLGGAAASMYLSKNSSEYEGLILLGAYSSKNLSESGLKVLSVYGSNDQVMKKECYDMNRDNLPIDFSEVIIEGGCHAYFGSYGEQQGDGQADISPDEQQRITADAIIKWCSEGE